MPPLISKHFKPIPRYTACILRGSHAGRVAEVTAISTLAFSINGRCLAYLELGTGAWTVAPIEHLVKV
jgi:hypothetical protein